MTGAALCDSLDGSTTGRQDGGSFTQGGWKPGWAIRWDLGTFLTEGAFSADLDNWDPSSSSPQHQYDKQQILDMYEDGAGDTHHSQDTHTAFFTIRTGKVYNDLFKFGSSPNGFDERIETRLSPPHGRIDPQVRHTVRVEWTAGGSVTVFLDGDILKTHPHGSSLPLRYVFVGSDYSGGEYGPQAGVIYSNIQVWGSTGGGRVISARLASLDAAPQIVEHAPNPLRRGLLSWFQSAKLPPFATWAVAP